MSVHYSRRIKEGGWGEIEIRKPDNHEEFQAEKFKAKAAKRGLKRKDREEVETEAKRLKKFPVARFPFPLIRSCLVDFIQLMMLTQ